MHEEGRARDGPLIGEKGHTNWAIALYGVMVVNRTRGESAKAIFCLLRERGGRQKASGVMTSA